MRRRQELADILSLGINLILAFDGDSFNLWLAKVREFLRTRRA